MACGTGKSPLQVWAAMDARPQSVIVFAPSLELIRQLRRTWSEETVALGGIEMLSVCSDKIDEDSSVAEPGEATTAPSSVGQFLVAPLSRPKVIFCTYQSSAVVAQAAKATGFSFDVGVFDEAHRTAGADKERFGIALHDSEIPIGKRLFFTATQRVVRARARIRGSEKAARTMYSMDNEALYGPVAYSLGFAKAVEQKLICPYRILISVVDASVPGPGSNSGEALAGGHALIQSMQDHGLKKAITFHSTVAEAKRFTDSVEVGESILRLHVNGAQPQGDRKAVMARFASANRAIISNARCLTEGVDVPSVDLVAFMDPKGSQIDIVQAAGRAMRLAGRDKTHGYILIPLHLNVGSGETLEDAISRSNFETVLSTIAALSENDEQIASVFESAAIMKGQGLVEEQILRSFASADSPIQIALGSLASHVSDDLARRIKESISIRVLAENSDDWFVEFGRYLQAKGKKKGLDEPVVQAWMRKQRRNNLKGELEPRKKVALDKTGFDFTPELTAAGPMFKSAQEFIRKHGSIEQWTSVEAQKDAGLNGLRDWLKHHLSYSKSNGYPPELRAAFQQIGFDLNQPVPEDAYLKERRKQERLAWARDRAAEQKRGEESLMLMSFVREHVSFKGHGRLEDLLYAREIGMYVNSFPLMSDKRFEMFINKPEIRTDDFLREASMVSIYPDFPAWRRDALKEAYPEIVIPSEEQIKAALEIFKDVSHSAEFLWLEQGFFASGAQCVVTGETDPKNLTILSPIFQGDHLPIMLRRDILEDRGFPRESLPFMHRYSPKTWRIWTPANAESDRERPRTERQS